MFVAVPAGLAVLTVPAGAGPVLPAGGPPIPRDLPRGALGCEHLSEEVTMSSPAEPAAHRDDVPMLEEDETVPPRPEEEVADLLRAKPDEH